MTSLAEIENAIKQLPEDDIRQLAGWLQTYIDTRWDQQLETDLATGKLDALIAQAESRIQANQVRDLNEVIDNT